MSDLVGNAKDRFSRVTAHIALIWLSKVQTKSIKDTNSQNSKFHQELIEETRAQLFKTNDVVS